MTKHENDYEWLKNGVQKCPLCGILSPLLLESLLAASLFTSQMLTLKPLATVKLVQTGGNTGILIIVCFQASVFDFLWH